MKISLELDDKYVAIEIVDMRTIFVSDGETEISEPIGFRTPSEVEGDEKEYEEDRKKVTRRGPRS